MDPPPEFLSPKIIIETDCQDYIIDMTAFVLEPEEVKLASEIHSKPYEKYIVIVASRCSSIIAYSFDKIDDNSKKFIIYDLHEAHKNRILCIKSFKPTPSEQNNLKIELPFCFISGGLDPELKIWDALSGSLLKKIEFHQGYIVDCFVFQIGMKSLYYEDNCGKINPEIKNGAFGNVVVTVGPVKTISIVGIENGDVDQILTYGKNSINSIEAIGAFSSRKSKQNNYLLFSIVDKGSFLTVWKISKKNKEIKCKSISKIEMLMSWILGLSSFSNSADPYKSKLKSYILSY